MKPDRRNLLLEMLQEQPTDTFLNYALALEYKANQDLQAALEQLDKTILLDENYLPAFFQKGQILANLGRAEDALQTLYIARQLAHNQNNKKALGEITELILALED
jgi:tetratricopeptide (TPR) repeat protein